MESVRDRRVAYKVSVGKTEGMAPLHDLDVEGQQCYNVS
jgi:hypothetical protein